MKNTQKLHCTYEFTQRLTIITTGRTRRDNCAVCNIIPRNITDQQCWI